VKGNTKEDRKGLSIGCAIDAHVNKCIKLTLTENKANSLQW